MYDEYSWVIGFIADYRGSAIPVCENLDAPLVFSRGRSDAVDLVDLVDGATRKK